jgi:hypothetical protein
LVGGEAPNPGIIALVPPDGSSRQVADGIEFRNDIVVTPRRLDALIVVESFAGHRPQPVRSRHIVRAAPHSHATSERDTPEDA